MSERALPTVRVRNPAAPHGYMVINASDLSDAYDVWPEQAPGYVELAPVAAVSDDGEGELATRIVGKLLARKIGCSDEEWSALPADERMSLMADAEREIDGAKLSDYPRVGKGPGGRWYVIKGQERISAGFATEEEAHEERSRLAAA